MTTEAKIKLTSSELGSLWEVYESTTARLKMYDFFRAKTIDKEAQNILTNHIIDAQDILNKVVNVFNIEFIESKNYMSGLNIFSDKWALNTIEVGYIVESIEVNILIIQLLTGFAQVATEGEVKKHFIEGKELSEKVVTKLSELLLESDIQPPTTLMGKATDSIQTSFSDKLMMYITGLMFITSLGFTGLGASFNMRPDLPLKLAVISKDNFNYTKKGSIIMIEHKWMEELFVNNIKK